MKNLITVSLFCIMCLLANATQRTVNNNQNLPNNPGQYTDIATAIGASAAGDTILVAGSPYTYNSTAFNVSKKIVLLGPGYNPSKQNPLAATIGGGITFNANNASGSVVMGFILSGGVTFESGFNLNGVTIRRNVLGSSVYIQDSTANLTVAENVMTGGYIYISTAKNQFNMVITNNVFTQTSLAFYLQFLPATNYLPIKVLHNLFINGTKNNPSISSNWATFANATSDIFYNMIVENNIFYNVNPGPPTSQAFSNFTYDNNISYAGGTLPTMPPTGNIGSANINNTDPMMVSLFNNASNAILDYNLDNLRLAAGSPGINAGTDGTNIGPTGGLYPIYVSTNQVLTGEPTIPEVKSATFIGASSTAPGGNLQIQVKAQKID